MKHVISPLNTMTLEKGKKYPIVNVFGDFFTIEKQHTKANCDLFCIFKGCAHIDFLDWIIEEEE